MSLRKQTEDAIIEYNKSKEEIVSTLSAIVDKYNDSSFLMSIADQVFLELEKNIHEAVERLEFSATFNLENFGSQLFHEYSASVMPLIKEHNLKYESKQGSYISKALEYDFQFGSFYKKTAGSVFNLVQEKLKSKYPDDNLDIRFSCSPNIVEHIQYDPVYSFGGEGTIFVGW